MITNKSSFTEFEQDYIQSVLANDLDSTDEDLLGLFIESGIDEKQVSLLIKTERLNFYNIENYEIDFSKY